MLPGPPNPAPQRPHQAVRVVGSLQPGFTLRGTLGAPEEGATRLLKATIAKEGVRETTLLSASERASARSGRPLYQFEYRVDYPGLQGKEPTFTVCVVGSKDDTLYTFASRVPSAVWAENADALREAARRFALLCRRRSEAEQGRREERARAAAPPHAGPGGSSS